MNAGAPMVAVSGRVSAVDQHTMVTEHYPSEGVTPVEPRSEVVALRLNGEALPLRLNTTLARVPFVGSQDELDVAGLHQGDHIAIYGIRNRTDGTVYVARPANVNSRWGSHFMAGLILLAFCITAGTMAWKDAAMWDEYLLMAGACAVLVAAVYGIGALLRHIGLIGSNWSAHAQDGDRQQMAQAMAALRLTDEERRRVWMV